MSDLDRRDFLKLVGVGAGAAAAAGCAEPIEKLVPYVIQPEEITPGIAVKYASTCRECPVGCGLHVTTREGRPIKLEGNPDHPINQGKLCARGQAGIGHTYHPDRYPAPSQKSGEAISWEQAIAKLAGKLDAAGGQVRVLGSDRGPTLNILINKFTKAVGGQRVVYEPFSPDALRAASGLVFGAPVVPLFDLSKADLILDFGSDFLDGGLSPVEHARQFAAARDLHAHKDGGARLVTMGPRLSMTGSQADQWIASKAGTEGEIARGLAAAVLKKTGGKHVSGDLDAVKRALAGASLESAAKAADVDVQLLKDLADKISHAHHAVALPPSIAATGPAAANAAGAVLILNALLGAVVDAVKLPERESLAPGARMAEINALIADMKAGKVKVLLIHDSNPVYSLAGDSGFADALDQVDLVVSFASLKNETSERADLVLPDHTPLESWGDAMPRVGVHSVQQPTIQPLWDTRALGDTLLDASRAMSNAGATLPEGSFKDVLERTWAEGSFRDALSVGGAFTSTPYRAGTGVAATAAQVGQSAVKLSGSGDLALVPFAHSFLSDGSGANLPWLQETPDPTSRISWNSWVELSFATANSLGVDFGDVVSISTSVGEVQASVLPRGGIRDDVVALGTGQGHTVGHYASMAGDGEEGAARGANVISLLSSKPGVAGARAWVSVNASVKGTGEFRRLALAQWMDNQRKRELAPEVQLADLAGHGDDHGAHDSHAAFKIPYDPALDASPEDPYRWGMTIDNDKCTGCGACVVACGIENNIPQVGEQQSIMHREMSWIRLDRYNGDGDREGGAERRPYPNREKLGEVDVRIAAMLCQHCGAAPCESVCPVIATYHTNDGLNGMVYNRCVGTRYCANNCTYKVRRFNYWDYSDLNWPGLLDMMLNPEATVRGRGVMEKCTFCVQRIAGARQGAKDEGRPIADGEVVTACQQSCPSGAIEFGNTKDAESAVVSNASDKVRGYHALHDLNTRPAITYLAQVRREQKHGAAHDNHESKGSH